MSRELLVAEFMSTPWALMPERLASIHSMLTRWSQSVPASTATLETVAADRAARDARSMSSASSSTGGIAVLPLYGVVMQRGNMIDNVSGPGVTSTQVFSNALKAALQDGGVSQILIDIDSPGGSVYGVAELADEILAARKIKPIVAIANSMAASAAYWIGCSASELYVTPGGEVGSIGVWQAHQDMSAALEDSGVKTTLISAGKYKTEGNPYTPLDEDAIAFAQSRVNDYHAAFVSAVARGRAVSLSHVRDGMGQGRVLGAQAALAEHMIDGIATMPEVIRKMQKSTRPAASKLNQARNAMALW
jgi:signal peptide peptidase SppA